MIWYLRAKVKKGFVVFKGLRYWDTIVNESVEQWCIEACHTVSEKPSQMRWLDTIIFEAADLYVGIHPTY